MLLLKDTVIINANPSDVFQWFERLDENYVAWHPAHVCCRYVKKHKLEKGAVLYAEEYLHGKLHKLRFELIGVVPGQEIRYKISPGISGSFRFILNQGATQFEAEINIGWNSRWFGHLLDRAIGLFFSKNIEQLSLHMQEEGRNLCNLMDKARTGAERG